VTIIKVPRRPTFPTTQPKRRYIITPRIVSMDGVKTPPKVPSPLDFPACALIAESTDKGRKLTNFWRIVSLYSFFLTYKN
jgi:hypothetical protein